LQTLKGHRKGLDHAFFSPDGKNVVTTSWDGTARIWDAESGKTLHELQRRETLVSWLRGVKSISVVFSPDGKKIVVSDANNTFRVLDAVSGKKLHTLTGLGGYVYSSTFSPDGTKFAIAGGDSNKTEGNGIAIVYDINTGRALQTLVGHEVPLCVVVFSPDGKKIVTADYKGGVRIWDTETGRVLQKLEGLPDDYVRPVVFSPDGKKIITVVSWDHNIVRIWNVETGKILQTLEAPRVSDAIFSSDGERIVTGSGNRGAIEIWNAESGKLLQTLPEHMKVGSFYTFSADGRKAVTTSWNDTTHTVRIWTLE